MGDLLIFALGVASGIALSCVLAGVAIFTHLLRAASETKERLDNG